MRSNYHALEGLFRVMLGAVLGSVLGYHLVPSAPGAPLRPVSAPASSSAASRVCMQTVTTTTMPVPRKGGGPMGNINFTGQRKRDSAVNDETMRWYLSSIGTKRLLDKTEEVKLAMAVKELLAWDREGDRLEDELGRRPTRREWAVALGFSGTDESLVRFESQARASQLLPSRRPPTMSVPIPHRTSNQHRA